MNKTLLTIDLTTLNIMQLSQLRDLLYPTSDPADIYLIDRQIAFFKGKLTPEAERQIA